MDLLQVTACGRSFHGVCRVFSISTIKSCYSSSIAAFDGVRTRIGQYKIRWLSFHHNRIWPASFHHNRIWPANLGWVCNQIIFTMTSITFPALGSDLAMPALELLVWDLSGRELSLLWQKHRSPASQCTLVRTLDVRVVATMDDTSKIYCSNI